MRVAIGADHGGVTLKDVILPVLGELATSYHDFGAFDARAVDYPDVAFQVARAVAGGEFDRGILICGTGIGVCIAANKIAGIRAAPCRDPLTARLSREHNDANVLCLGGRILGPALAVEIARVWLLTPFSGDERHSRRIDKIARLDNGS